MFQISRASSEFSKLTGHRRQLQNYYIRRKRCSSKLKSEVISMQLELHVGHNTGDIISQSSKLFFQFSLPNYNQRYR